MAAVELASAGVTRNVIYLGWVKTRLVELQLEARAPQEGISTGEAAQRLLAEKHSILRFSPRHGIGGLVVFLCYDAAATINGAALSIDGG